MSLDSITDEIVADLHSRLSVVHRIIKVEVSPNRRRVTFWFDGHPSMATTFADIRGAEAEIMEIYCESPYCMGTDYGTESIAFICN